MKAPRYAAWISMVTTLVVASACSTPGPKPDPQVDAFSQSQKNVASGIEEGIEQSESIDEYTVALRFNPCQCAAPPHEIHIRGRWTRTYLDADEEIIEEIAAHLDEAGEGREFTTMLLEGALDGNKKSERGVDYPIFEIEALPTADEEQ